ncbi:MAG: biotin/lipoyl-binding protein [Phycisphaerales bacterium]|nr:biotin/lipoyl-binding protein [Phycisphaerales bacterium]
MKKWIGMALVLAVIGVGWYLIRTFVRIDAPGSEPKWEKVERGDIRVPITASGLIEPNERIEIKPEASGEIIDIKVVEGDFVHAGDVLVEIKKDDEQRNVERANQIVTRARIAHRKAELAVLSAEQAVDTARQRLAELEANGRRTSSDLKEETERLAEGRSSPRTVLLMEVADDINKSQTEQAKIAIKNAELALEDAKETVKVQEAAVQESQKDLDEANQRLRETTVVSKHDAIITEVKVQKQNIVQSGKNTFGGTVLLTMADVSQLKVVARVDEADYGRVSKVAPPEAMPEMPGLREAVLREMREAAERAATQASVMPRTPSTSSQPASDEAPAEVREAADELRTRSGNVSIVVEAFPDLTFAGRVFRVEPQGKLNVGASVIQFDVHVAVTDPMAFRLPLGTQAQVEFTVESATNVLTVPADAVKSVEGEKGVYVRSATDARNKLPRFVPCRFGITDGAKTHLIATLSGEALDETTEVYTKLPPVKEENED